MSCLSFSLFALPATGPTESPPAVSSGVGGWGDGGGQLCSDEFAEEFASVGAAAEGEWEDAIDIGIEEDSSAAAAAGTSSGELGGMNGCGGEEAPGIDPTTLWRKMPIAANLVAAGDFAGALHLLRRRLGLLRVAPFEEIFQRVFEGSWMYMKGHSFTPSLALPLTTGVAAGRSGLPQGVLAPPRVVSCSFMVTLIREAHKLVTGGKFAEALAAFRQALLTLAIAMAESHEEEQQLLEMLEICRNYTAGMALETARLALGEKDAKRNLELVAYFSCCRLQPSHAFLVLRRALSVAWKSQNYITAASFARRLLAGNYAGLKGAEEEVAKAKKVLMICEQKGTDAIQINYEPAEAENLLLCNSSLTRLPPGSPFIRCGFCGGIARSDLQGQLCNVCQVGELGSCGVSRLVLVLRLASVPALLQLSVKYQ
ncbi:coatomer alpha [Cyclospora cayetanensis]|uniref:Coatomer alpha n=1 Tax=Cyclospora cayetanensis TaxID=88456 RepID=A0A1D3D028_9EIME|nr:coatomer alpha [Cyclospora cayetanensis]